MSDYKYIKESLNFQDLSEEEKKARGILGRLYGPCASIIAPTRNGRKYNDELWEKVFNENEIVKEMFANGGIPMELDHPTDREETCSEKIAAMLPEAPKRDQDGHLICYVDLIDTPCGKIAYQLAKYGFKLGISSRGTGDLYTDENGNESVDPDTYDFTTFDLVLLPAVKEARLQMCESLDTTSMKLKKALKESMNIASDEDKKIMEETLKDLKINLEESDPKQAKQEAVDFSNVQIIDGDTENLTEDQEVEAEDAEMLNEIDVDADVAETVDSIENNEKAESTEVEATETEPTEDEAEAYTVGDLQKELEEYDKSLDIEFKPIEIEGKNYAIEMLGFDDSETGKLVVSIGYTDRVADNNNNIKDEEEITPEEEVTEESSEVSEEAVDDGADEILENFKELVRQKDLLEQANRDLKNEKAVGDAKVKELTESLAKYKNSYERMSEVAAKAKKLDKEVGELKESLSAKDKKIKQLLESKNTEQANVTNLTESLNDNSKKVQILTEKLQGAKKELEQKNKDFEAQTSQYKKIIASKNQLAENYKSKYESVVEGFINSKAKMLGVRVADIKANLTENYTFEDIEKVCDEMLEQNVNLNRLPFNINRGSKVQFNENKQQKPANNTADCGLDQEGFEDLYRLAGLVD